MSQPETIKGEDENVQKEKPIVIRNSTDLQRIKLEKLMKNPVSNLIIMYLQGAIKDFCTGKAHRHTGKAKGAWNAHRSRFRPECDGFQCRSRIRGIPRVQTSAQEGIR